MIETVYWHQQRCFSGELEAGFFYEMQSDDPNPSPVFYFNSNDNCGIPGNCHTTQNADVTFTVTGVTAESGTCSQWSIPCAEYSYDNLQGGSLEVGMGVVVAGFPNSSDNIEETIVATGTGTFSVWNDNSDSIPTASCSSGCLGAANWYQNEDSALNSSGYWNPYPTPTAGVTIQDITFNGSQYQNQQLIYHWYVTPNAAAPNGYQFQVEVATPSDVLVDCTINTTNTNSAWPYGDTGTQTMSFTSKPCSFPIQPDPWYPIQTLANASTAGYITSGTQVGAAAGFPNPTTSPSPLNFAVTDVKIGR